MDIKTEILYLARGGKEHIFVEKCPKQQHIVDGIRFIYRQYVKSVLKRPVLILCSEGDEGKWQEYFETWTSMGNDITTDTKNPFTNKVSVYISPVHDVTKFCNREWDGVIIDSDTMHKEILKININAKFKVWITGVDVKNDLTIFSQLYKWLYPKERFDANIFEYDKRDPSDVVAKAILLDSFMEDVVLRSNDLGITTVKLPEIPKVTRKNKDATGTKIKRTKRKNRISSSEEDSPTKTSKTNETASNDNNYKNNTSKSAEISNFRSRSTIDDSRTAKNSSRATIADTRATIDETRTTMDGTRPTRDDIRATLDVLGDKTVDSSKIRIEYYDEDKTNDQRHIMNEISEKSPIICDEEDNSMDLLLKYEIDDKYAPFVVKKSNGGQSLELDESYLDQKPESNDSAYNKDTQENFDEVIKFKETESCPDNIKDGIKSNYTNNIPLVSNEITEITSNDQIILNNNEIKNKIDLKTKELTKEVKESEDLFSTESMTSLNEILTSKQQIILNTNKNEKELSKQVKLQSEDLFSTESMSTLHTNRNEIIKDGVGNKETDPSSNLDAKIKKMEELAMKKFKGSLLDSIF